MSLISRLTFLKNVPAFCRGFHVSLPVGTEEMTETGFKMAGFHKYGLLRDDLLNEFDPVVKEAVRRLPEELQLQRLYRAIKAQQVEISHGILPEEEWSCFGDDHYYLRPYIEEIEAEIAERKEWEANH